MLTAEWEHRLKLVERGGLSIRNLSVRSPP
jgi:hypothetical protein